MDLKEKTFELVSADRSADRGYPRSRLNSMGLLRLNSANVDGFCKFMKFAFDHLEARLK